MIEQLGIREIGDQPRAQRVLVRVLRLGEAPQVADHHQDVLVDRVDVIQIVLHLADDAAERGQVAAEDAVLVHPPQLMRDAARLAQNREEIARDWRDRGGTRRRRVRGDATSARSVGADMPFSSG